MAEPVRDSAGTNDGAGICTHFIYQFIRLPLKKLSEESFFQHPTYQMERGLVQVGYRNLVF
jgi:hypothetical protein